MLRPVCVGWLQHLFVQKDDPVEVVGHHDEGVEFHPRKVVGNLQPTSAHNPAEPVQYYLFVHNRSENALALVAANSHEIEARPGIVIISQADGATMAFQHAPDDNPNYFPAQNSKTSL